jgi:hypothetical protein
VIGRLHVVQIELGDDADRVQDRVQLALERLDLVLCQRQPRQPRDM